MKTNFEHTFTQLIKALKVPVTKTSALEYLSSHPNEGSLLAYSETLDRFRIENAAIKVEKDRFDELPTPFVAYLHQYGGTFALVKEVTDAHVDWLDTKKDWIKTPKEDFLKSWQGIALLAETSSVSGEKNYARKRKSEILNVVRIPFAIGLCTLVAGIFIQPLLAHTTLSMLILLKTMGMVLSSLLLAKSINSKNDWINRLCNNGKTINCQSILDSPAAHITSWLSWSDLGFIYFFGSFFALLFSFYSGTVITFLNMQCCFSIGGVIFSAYSLWYQSVRSKLWCTLCLAVVVIVILEALLVFSNFNFDATLGEVKYNLTGLIIPIVFLLLYKTTAVKALEQNILQKKLHKIYANPTYFKSFIENQPKMPEIPNDMPTVFLGNHDAEHVITLVSNPLCSPCASMHKQLEELVKENPNVKCQVVFLSGETNAGGQFVRKLFSLPQDLQAEAMNLWYNRNDKNFDKWNKAYKSHSETKESFKIQRLHNHWVNYAEIKGTPALFINGKRKSAGINVDEIGSMLTMQKAELLA